MTTRKPDAGGPREPHNIPVRFYTATHPSPSESRLAEIEKMVRKLESTLNEALSSGRFVRNPGEKPREARPWSHFIEIDSSDAGGKAVTRRTGVPVQSLVDAYRGGKDWVALCIELGVTDEEFKAAIICDICTRLDAAQRRAGRRRRSNRD
jgi:uncharacterized protein (DUF433 family)